MISIAKKFIFIHINKTAGVSVNQALQSAVEDVPKWTYDKAKRYFGEPVILPPGVIPQSDIKFKHAPHWTYDEYERYLGKSFNDFFKFSVVRNPWDRVVSYYLMKLGRHSRFRRRFPTFKKWIVSRYKKNDFTNRMLKPCTYWLGDKMDFIARFENLHEDFEKTCKILNVKCKLGHYKRSKDRDHYINYYDSETREIIQTHFIKDIDAFNYKF